MKETGIDRVIDKVIHRIGNLICVYLTGDFARGKDSRVIDLILVGDRIDSEYLSRKVMQAEVLVGRKVNYILVEPGEAEQYLSSFKPADLFPVWTMITNELIVK